MTTDNTYDIDLFPFQMEVFDCQTRFRTVAAGRRVGKTYLACVEALDEATSHPYSRVLIIGPTYGQAKQAFWLTLKSLCAPQWLSRDPLETELTLKFINGSDIILKGIDRPETLRGMSPSPTFIVNDERAFWKPEAYEYVVAPMISDRSARVLSISTPNGVGNEFHDEFLRGQSDDYDNHTSFQFTAEEARPDLQDEINSRRNEMDPKAFQQEYAATFLNTGNACFHAWNREYNVRTDLDWFSEDEDIHVSIDFNVNIMSAAAFAVRGNEMHYLREYQGDTDTFALSDRLNRDYPDRNIFVYPDPSGKSMKSSARLSDFAILEKAGFKVRAKKAAPSQSDSVVDVNAMLRNAAGTTRLFFANTMRRGIQSMEGTQWSKNDDTKIDKSNGMDHFSDHVRYAVNYLFPVKEIKPMKRVRLRGLM